MRILKLEAENVLNLRAVAITPDRRTVRLTGKNGAGKSNVLNAAFSALAGRTVRANELLRRGTDSARVRLELGDTEVEYVITLRATPGRESLDITAPNGSIFRKPQALLDALIGQLSFDPHQFQRMNPKERRETLRRLVKLDVDVDELDRLNERDFAERTNWNREVKRLTEREQTLRGGVDLAMDTHPIDVSALGAKINAASEQRAAVEREAERRAANHRQLAQWEEQRTELLARIERLTVQVREREFAIAELKAALDVEELPAAPDVSALADELNEANRENSRREQQVRQRASHLAAVNELAAAKAMSEALTEAMDSRHARKLAAFASASMPIELLTFGDGDVFYKGLPFAQASTGEATRVSVAIGMALNPKLRVIFVRDANLLDEDSLAIIEAMAEERDYQVFYEFTQSSPTVGIHIVDGEVAYIDGEAVEAPTDEAVLARTE